MLRQIVKWQVNNELETALKEAKGFWLDREEPFLKKPEMLF
jgi:hypothetical protein